jgi:flagellar L-ring protein precursor FlgH
MRATFTFLLAFAVSGCAVSHIDSYEPKRRNYLSPVDLSQATGESHNGSLYNAGGTLSRLFADPRAMRLGDIVTIRVSEQADAKRAASTDLSRDADTSLGLDALFGLLKLAADALPSGDKLAVDARTGFSGQGTTSRSENLQATVPAIVRKVLPNGNLFIEGHRVVLVNNEEHHFYVSGVIRPLDIEGDNSVSSAKVADAEVEFTGRGVVSEKLNPGWLQRGLDFLRPL